MGCGASAAATQRVGGGDVVELAAVQTTATDLSSDDGRTLRAVAVTSSDSTNEVNDATMLRSSPVAAGRTVPQGPGHLTPSIRQETNPTAARTPSPISRSTADGTSSSGASSHSACRSASHTLSSGSKHAAGSGHPLPCVTSPATLHRELSAPLIDFTAQSPPDALETAFSHDDRGGVRLAASGSSVTQQSSSSGVSAGSVLSSVAGAVDGQLTLPVFALSE